MKIIDLKFDKNSGLIYCNTDIGFYTIRGIEVASKVAFSLEKSIVESREMLNYFAVILEAMYVENPLLFKYVQHTIKYKFRGKQKKVSYNIYIDAIDAVKTMRELGIYENIKTNFKEV